MATWCNDHYRKITSRNNILLSETITYSLGKFDWSGFQHWLNVEFAVPAKSGEFNAFSISNQLDAMQKWSSLEKVSQPFEPLIVKILLLLFVRRWRKTSSKLAKDYLESAFNEYYLWKQV